MPILHHVELAPYIKDMVAVTTFLKLMLLVDYLQTYLSSLETWLWIWRIAINTS